MRDSAIGPQKDIEKRVKALELKMIQVMNRLKGLEEPEDTTPPTVNIVEPK